jgi:hypothetical protein
MVSVTVVSSGNPAAGVKVADVPATFQEPATEGDSRGSGEFCASGAENPTWIGLIPFTLRELEPGVTEVT